MKIICACNNELVLQGVEMYADGGLVIYADPCDCLYEEVEGLRDDLEEAQARIRELEAEA